jgi:hypothetical protein
MMEVLVGDLQEVMGVLRVVIHVEEVVLKVVGELEVLEVVGTENLEFNLMEDVVL